MKPMNISFLALAFTAALLFSHSQAEAAKTICTMTFNSQDEREVLRRIYEPTGAKVVELVPTNNDAHWFEKACASNIRCDILLISGHFGGIFFGEQLTATLDMDQLANASCQRSCPGVLESPKEVLLMGCNTLASKTPDHRSIDQYLKVLVGDGFPRDLAEKVASARYAKYGQSISQEMASVFYNANKIYGFGSTGPLGRQNAPLLTKAMRAQSEDHSSALLSAYAKTSFRALTPSQALSAYDRNLMCLSRSSSNTARRSSFQAILQPGQVKNYLDVLLANANDEQLKTLKSEGSKVREEIAAVINQVWTTSESLTETRFNIMTLLESLGLATSAAKIQKVEDLVNARMQQGLNYISADQICAIAKKEPRLVFRYSWLTKIKYADLAFLPRVANCFNQREEMVENYLRQIVFAKVSASTRKEALRATTGSWFGSERIALQNSLYDWDSDSASEAYLSLKIPFEMNTSALGSCLSQSAQASSPSRRDEQRWLCFQNSKTQIRSLRECQGVAAQFETSTVSGVDWHCLNTFSSNLGLSSCSAAAERNVDVTNSDDMRWFCWDKLAASKKIDPAECLGLAQSMKIYGNRIKQNWNCVNRIAQ